MSRLAALALLLLAVAPVGHAAELTATLSVARGHLTIAAPSTAVRVRLGAGMPTAHATAARRAGVLVADRRGTGAGWTLQLAVTLREIGGRPVPRAAVAVMGVSASCRSACTLPRSSVSYPVAVSATPVRVLSARRGSGMGAIRLAAGLHVTMPAGAPSRPYVLVPAWSRVAGP